LSIALLLFTVSWNSVESFSLTQPPYGPRVVPSRPVGLTVAETAASDSESSLGASSAMICLARIVVLPCGIVVAAGNFPAS
jgi:hypothetical protein